MKRWLRWLWDHPPGYLWVDYVMRRREMDLAVEQEPGRPVGVKVVAEDGRVIELDDTLSHLGVDSDGISAWVVHVPAGIKGVRILVDQLPERTTIQVVMRHPKVTP